MKIMVTLASWGFCKRLCWMMSSVLQQVPYKDLPVPEVSFNLAFIRNTGVDQVKELFERNGLKSAQVIFETYEAGFSYRGLVRNEQLKACDADWVLFADSDMVYPPEYFARVANALETTYKDNPKCLFMSRWSNEEAEAEALVNDPAFSYPCIIPDAYDKAATLKLRGCRNVGAGYCQIANMELLRKNHEGLYQPKDRVLDGPIGTSLRNKSDRNFRVTLGAEPLIIPDNMRAQIHLQHPRQKNDYPK
jgi:hypothetical protein